MRIQLRSSGFMYQLRGIAAIGALFGTLGLSQPAFANSTAEFKQMLGDDLKAVFNETMMVGEYRAYRDETETNNYTEYHFEDGSTDYKEGPQRERGVWNLVGPDKICYKYPDSANYRDTYCFFVYESEGCYYKYSLEAMSLRGPKSYDYWSSRAVRKGSGKSCAAPIS